jgi:hypothetical protein
MTPERPMMAKGMALENQGKAGCADGGRTYGDASCASV